MGIIFFRIVFRFPAYSFPFPYHVSLLSISRLDILPLMGLKGEVEKKYKISVIIFSF